MNAAHDVVLWGREAGALERWRSNAADDSHASLAVESGPSGPVLRFDHDLAAKGSWAIARLEIAFDLPAHFVVSIRARAESTAQQFQVKLVDPTGANVWWWRRPMGFPAEPDPLVLRQVSLEFAWGPLSGANPEKVGAVEIGIAGDRGGRGSIWIEDLRIEARPVVSGPPAPQSVIASSAVKGHEAGCAIQEDEAVTWRPDPSDAEPWLEMDLGELREWGGLVVDFAGDATPPARVLASDDGAKWHSLLDDPGGASGARWLETGEVDSRYVRLVLPSGAADGLKRVDVVPIELAASPARWAEARAQAAPRGRYPRHLLREQAYWAVAGGDGDERKGLLGADGALEIDAESWSIEPFLWANGRLFTWNDVELGASLAEGSLPVPSVEWTTPELRLRITAFSIGEPLHSSLVARYEVESLRGESIAVRLFLATRPFQVTPSWQSLNLVGGIAPIARLERDGARVRVNRSRELIAVTAPDDFGAATAQEGLAALFEGRVPANGASISDALGFAEGALAFDLQAHPAGSSEYAEVVVAVPLFAESEAPPSGLTRDDAAVWGDDRLADALAFWRDRLACVGISLPPSGARIEASLRASIAWILVNREGPRIQPGPRCYRRSWIRDGTLTGMALVEMGFADEARNFLRWYAPYQLEDGRVPCAVDRHGVDLVPEHDSHGQLIWGTVELYRLTKDRSLLEELWPRLLRAADAIAALRAQRTTDAYRGKPSFGLMPESISHEGYSSQPVHSFWDDFFAVRGLADAAEAASILGDASAAERIGVLRDEMTRDLRASIVATMAQHEIDFIPGSVDLGDFDPTSTAIAFDPCRQGEGLPRDALERTYERYWQELEDRRGGRRSNDAYTAYEVRTACALLALGWKDRAVDLLEWLVGDQRLPAWCEWPEVSTRDPRAPRFLGDLPHGWIASSFVRSVRRLIAWEDLGQETLVIAAGVPEAWVEPPGISVRALPTYYGTLDLTLVAEGPDRVRARLGGTVRPPGGVVITSPLAKPLREFQIDGRAHPGQGSPSVLVREVPADILLLY